MVTSSLSMNSSPPSSILTLLVNQQTITPTKTITSHDIDTIFHRVSKKKPIISSYIPTPAITPADFEQFLRVIHVLSRKQYPKRPDSEALTAFISQYIAHCASRLTKTTHLTTPPHPVSNTLPTYSIPPPITPKYVYNTIPHFSTSAGNTLYPHTGYHNTGSTIQHPTISMSPYPRKQHTFQDKPPGYGRIDSTPVILPHTMLSASPPTTYYSPPKKVSPAPRSPISPPAASKKQTRSPSPAGRQRNDHRVTNKSPYKKSYSPVSENFVCTSEFINYSNERVRDNAVEAMYRGIYAPSGGRTNFFRGPSIDEEEYGEESDRAPASATRGRSIPRATSPDELPTVVHEKYLDLAFAKAFRAAVGESKQRGGGGLSAAEMLMDAKTFHRLIRGTQVVEVSGGRLQRSDVDVAFARVRRSSARMLITLDEFKEAIALISWRCRSPPYCDPTDAYVVLANSICQGLALEHPI